MSKKAQHIGRGERIRLLRRMTETSQLEISKRSGVSPATISLVEHGYHSKPETIRKIERALGLEASDE
jgi:transcriptional regulator with XRE-family HTH domain